LMPVIFVIAADDGIMPQTRNISIFSRCWGVQARRGVLTKIDRSSARVEAVMQEVREYLRNTFLKEAPIYPYSNFTVRASAISMSGFWIGSAPGSQTHGWNFPSASGADVLCKRIRDHCIRNSCDGSAAWVMPSWCTPALCPVEIKAIQVYFESGRAGSVRTVCRRQRAAMGFRQDFTWRCDND
jgi:translation elongation factor EF-G